MKKFLWTAKFWLWWAAHYGYNKYSFSRTANAYDQRIDGLRYLSQFDDPGHSDTPYGHMSPMEEDSGWHEPPSPKFDGWCLLELILGIALAIVILLAILSTGAHPG